MASVHISGLTPETLYPLDPEGDFSVHCTTIEGDGSLVSERNFAFSSAQPAALPRWQSPGPLVESRIQDGKSMKKSFAELVVSAMQAGC